MEGAFATFSSLVDSMGLTTYRWMTFCPEWLTGSPNLNTSNPLYLWVYLFVRHICLRVKVLMLMVPVVHEHSLGGDPSLAHVRLLRIHCQRSSHIPPQENSLITLWDDIPM